MEPRKIKRRGVGGGSLESKPWTMARRSCEVSRRWFAGSAAPPVLVHLPSKQLICIRWKFSLPKSSGPLCSSSLNLGAQAAKIWWRWNRQLIWMFHHERVFLNTYYLYLTLFRSKGRQLWFIGFLPQKSWSTFSFRKWTTDFKLGPISKSWFLVLWYCSLLFAQIGGLAALADCTETDFWILHRKSDFGDWRAFSDVWTIRQKDKKAKRKKEFDIVMSV